ncbi:DEKNAAC105663 [Brettanomyces naardenensis]|uniref:DEKNAAC105663 n=1 Tax=Brettanomyces naardenensis TaxID=13370 RepID=A0A448YU03_BRENA|nr:DEKNAAC105663 [Brettanomyces naardenensis]
MTSDDIPDIDVDERVDKDLKTLVKPWRLPQPKKLAFVNGIIVDSLKGRTIEGSVVLSEGGYFTDIVSSEGFDPKDYKVIDCLGKYLCPGLFDFHVHLVSVPSEDGLTRTMRMPKESALMRVGSSCEQMLKRGFTSARDCGGLEHFIADAVEDGAIYGPRLFFCGHAISQTGGHGDTNPTDLPGEGMESCNCHLANLAVVADGTTECMKAAREQFRRGASFIKIMGGGGVASPSDRLSNRQFTAEEIKSIVSVADTYHSFVTAHTYTPEAIKYCIENGVKGVEHGNFLDDECAELMAKKGCYLTPTLVTYKVMASKQWKLFLTSSSQEKNLEVIKVGLRALLIAKRHNVKMCYGSDLLGAMQDYETGEFFLRGKVLPAADVLRAATVTPAEALGLSDKIGQIKKGFYADLLLLEENPLDDIGTLDLPETNLLMVMKQGVVYSSKFKGLKEDVSGKY